MEKHGCRGFSLLFVPHLGKNRGCKAPITLKENADSFTGNQECVYVKTSYQKVIIYC